MLRKRKLISPKPQIPREELRVWISEPDNNAQEGFIKALSLTKGKYVMCMPISEGLISYSETRQGKKDDDIIEYIKSKNYLLYADTHVNSIFIIGTMVYFVL